MRILRNREELELMVVAMYQDGWGKRALARHFDMSRNTIRRILCKNETHRSRGHTALGGGKIPRKSKLDVHMPLI